LLVINGSNFRGLKRIYLGNATGEDRNSSIQVDPSAMPTGITINAAGTQISMTMAAIDDINATWLNSVGGAASRRILLLSAADQNATSPLIVPNR
jgi:DNA-binding beta-propeller fold protein YncE